MNTETALKLLVALARALNIDPVTLAAMFNQDDQNQSYFDELVRLTNTAPRNMVH